METKRTFQPDIIRYGYRKVYREVGIVENLYSSIHEWVTLLFNNLFVSGKSTETVRHRSKSHHRFHKKCGNLQPNLNIESIGLMDRMTKNSGQYEFIKPIKI